MTSSSDRSTKRGNADEFSTPLHANAGGGSRLAYTVDETATLLSIGRTTLYAKLASGDLRARKCGRKTLILATDVHLFLTGLATVKTTQALDKE